MRIKYLLRLNIIFSVIGLGLVFYLIAPALAATQPHQNFRQGELLIKFRNQAKIQKIKIDLAMDVKAVIEQYQSYPAVEYIEPNYLVEAVAFPNDPKNFEQWYLRPINAQQAWSKELLVRQVQNISRRAVIAVLDTGVDLDHPDLKDNIWLNLKERPNDGIDNEINGFIDDINGWDFVDNDNNPNPNFQLGYLDDAVNHGTLVSGIAAAVSHNRAGITGLSWFSQIMPLRVLDSTGSGDIFDVIQAIDYAIENGADVINMSFVGTDFSQPFLEAVRRADQSGVVVVAAAGNTDPSLNGINLDLIPNYPVCYDGVIGVGSVDSSLKKSLFSNYGSCVDIVAPGDTFFTTQVYEPSHLGFDQYYNGYWSGTSLSAPLVSGAAGIIKSLRPDLTAQTVRDFIIESANSVDSNNPEYKGELGGGLLDIFKAIDQALSRQSYTEETAANNYIVAGLGFGSFPQIKILWNDGTVFKSFFAYSPSFNGAINIAVGDVNGDGREEIVTGAGDKGGPHIRIFNIEGQVLGQFFAYNENLRGGVNIAVGDINGDGVDEIVTGSGRGSSPEVRIFNGQGELQDSFLAYDQKFQGGVKVAVGNVNSDSDLEIITGAGNGGGPHVRVFNVEGQVLAQFFAYNKDFHGGINVAAGDLFGNGRSEIIVSIENNSLPTVRVFDNRGVRLANFFAYDTSFLGGVNIATGDFDGNGIDEIITGSGNGAPPVVKVFNFNGVVDLELLTHEQSNYSGGVRPAILQY